ncbi:hypothetical protein KKF91_04190, partial [Myxococcota bacterium]|nr:hypothetical protein [Myxococcota bacterium]
MPATVPSALSYPVVHQLGTGAALEHVALQRVAEAINHCAAHLHAAPLIEQGFESGQGFEHTGAKALISRWRVPTLTQLHDHCLVLIEAKSTTGDGQITLTSNSGQVVFSVVAVGARGWHQGQLPIDAAADFDDLTLYLDGGTGALRIYSLHVSHQPLGSPLPAARLTQASGEAVIPMPQSPQSLTQSLEPLSAGLGRLLSANLKALRDGWRRMLWSAAGAGSGGGLLDAAHAEDFPTGLVRSWPGMEGHALKLWAWVMPHTANNTVFVFLINGRAVYRQTIQANPAQDRLWLDADLLIPEGEPDPCEGLPAFEVGI